MLVFTDIAAPTEAVTSITQRVSAKTETISSFLRRESVFRV